MKLRLQKLQEANSKAQKLCNKKLTVIKKSIRFIIIRAYCLYSKLFEQS